MRRLTLMRHADAQWKDPDIADFARPLNRRGIAEAEAMARRLAALQLIPDRLMASPARRTQQTSDIVARALALAARQVRHEEALYLAGARDILKIIRTTGPRVRHLMIIGHNPGISELVRLLAAQHGVGELTTGAMCSLALTTDKWSIAAAALVTEVQSEAPQPSLFGLWA